MIYYTIWHTWIAYNYPMMSCHGEKSIQYVTKDQLIDEMRRAYNYVFDNPYINPTEREYRYHHVLHVLKDDPTSKVPEYYRAVNVLQSFTGDFTWLTRPKGQTRCRCNLCWKE